MTVVNFWQVLLRQNLLLFYLLDFCVIINHPMPITNPNISIIKHLKVSQIFASTYLKQVNIIDAWTPTFSLKFILLDLWYLNIIIKSIFVSYEANVVIHETMLNKTLEISAFRTRLEYSFYNKILCLDFWYTNWYTTCVPLPIHWPKQVYF